MEKRLSGHKRHPVALPIFLFQENFSPNRPFANGTIFNISEGGCKLSTNHRFKLGETVALRFYVPSQYQQIRVYQATVCWVWGAICRLKFNEIQSKDLECLQEFTRSLEAPAELQPVEG